MRSISAIASAGIPKPDAFTLFSIWLGLLAPAITQLICGCCRIYAIDRIGGFVPSFLQVPMISCSM